MRYRTLLKYVLEAITVGCSIVAACFLLVHNAKQYIVPFEGLEPAPIAIVLGAKVKADQTPSDILKDRLLTAVDLYNANVVQKILLSGDDGQVEYDEVNAMRVFVLERGVLPEDIFLDHAGFDTYDSMVRANQVFGITHAIVVTQDFHLPRALYLARKEGIEAYGVSADRQTYRGAISMEIREVVADVKAVVNVLLDSPPLYLGESINSTGDGRVTWDEE